MATFTRNLNSPFRRPGAARLLIGGVLVTTVCIGCDPVDETTARALESVQADDGGTFDARAQWGGPRLSAGARAPFAAGEYDVLVLSQATMADSLARVHAAASRVPGAVLYSVQEADEIQFVVATPHSADEPSFPGLMRDVLDLSDGADGSSSGLCNVLYRYPGWFGAEFNVCGAGSNPKQYSNLGTYGFNNLASSYFSNTAPIGELELYDGTNFVGKLATLDWDDFNFSSSVDNKASSLRYWY